MRKSLKYKVFMTVLLVVLLIDLCFILFNYNNYVKINRNYVDSLAETVANTCNLVIDGDRVEGYLATIQRDSQYYETWNRLIDYRNTNPDIVNLSVVDFEDDGGHYVFDTDLTSAGAFLGDVSAFDSRQQQVKSRLIACAEIDAMEYQGYTNIYIPIKSSYNIPVAYVIVGISTANIKTNQLIYLMQITGIITVITVGFGALLLAFMNRSVIKPINDLTHAAANYSRYMGQTNQSSPLSQININTGDELERLCESMKKMENDILQSTVDLSLVTWNSQHDSMTQLYNKRYYLELLDQLADVARVGIIYFDIDNLKLVNDTYGHEIGDEVIVRAANFIHRYNKPGMYGCRVGGDEFVIIIRESKGKEIFELVETMRKDPAGYLAPDITEFCCRLAIGGTIRKEHEDLAETVVRADEKMYENKHVLR